MKNTEKIIVGYDAETETSGQKSVAENQSSDSKIIVGYDAEQHAQAEKTDRAFLRTEEFGVEDKTLRTANARYYITGNGERKAVITASPRHYYSEADKRMRRIDNTLELKNGVYENKYNGFKVRFAEDTAAENLMRVKKDGYEIAFALADNSATDGRMLRSGRRGCHAVLRDVKARMTDNADDKLESGIDYPDIFDGVNFEYEVKPNEIKENIRIAKLSDNYEFAFVVTANGLRLEANGESNEIEFYPESANINAEPVFTMPAPYMFDDDGETSYAVKYETESIGDGRYLLKIIPDETWINADDRKFPVTIDPTVVSSGNQFIYKIVPDYSKYPASSKFYRTEAGCQQIGYFDGRSDDANKIFGETYLYFELKSATKSKLAHISNALLSIPVYLSPYVLQANGYFAIYATNDSKWKNSSIDWKNNKPETEYEIIGSAKPYSKNGKNYSLEFDITDALRSGYTGFVIKGNHSNDFYNGGWQNSVYVPKEDSNSLVTLTISYLQDGYLRGGKSIAQSCNTAGNGSIDLFTGALTYVIDILKLEGTPLPIDISLVYNSNRKNELGFNGYTYGEGWMFNFMQSIKLISKAPYTSYKGDDYHECYEYTDAFGNKQEIDTRYYTYRGDKSYKRYQPYDGDTGVFAEISNDNFVLTKDPNSDNVIILTDKTGKKLKFVSGILASIEMPGTYYDNIAPKLEITYNNGTIKLKDSRGREVELLFKSMVGMWFFTGVKYNGETVCSIDDTGALITPYGKASFAYSGGCLKKITDGTDYTLEYKTSLTNGKVKVLGYTIKSATQEIAYNVNENAGVVTSATTKILEDVTIEYDSQITEGRFAGYDNMDNLTSVSNAAGAKTYYYFNSDGLALAVMDGKGNMEVNSLRSEIDENNYSSTVMQKTAQVLYSANTANYDPPHSHSAFSPNMFSDGDEITVVSDRYAQKGWYVFAVCLNGPVLSGKHFNNIEIANSRFIPYLALKVTKTFNDGKEDEVDFVRVDSGASGSSKNVMAFLPYYVGSDVGSVKVQIVTKNNPSFIYFNSWTVLKAAKGSSVKVYDTDKSITESYQNGLFTTTTSDITKLKNNTRKTVAQRGTASKIETTITYDGISLSSNTKVFPERVVKEEDQYLERTYTYDNCSNVTSEEIKDLSTSKIMRREYTYSNSNTALKNNNAPLSETDEDGNTYKYEYTGTGYLKRMTFPPIREIIPGTYFPGQDIDYAYSGIDGLLKSVPTPARNDVGECENKFSYNLGYLTKLNHFGCEYKFKYDGFGRMTEITVGDKLYSKTAYTDNGTDIDGVSGATSKTVTAYYDGTYIRVPYTGRSNCGDGSVASIPTAHAFASYYNKYGELIKVRYATDVTTDYAFSEADDYVAVEQINTYDRCAVKYTIGTTVYELDYDKSTGELLKRTEYENNIERLKLEITDHDGFGRVSGMKYSLDCMEAQSYKYAYKSNYDDSIKSVTLPNGKTDTVTTDNFGRITNRTLNASSALQDIIAYKTSKAQHGTTNSYTTPLISQMECRVGSTVKARYIYEYDVCGNITGIYDYGTLLSSYEYDGLNRLIRENCEKDDTVTVITYDDGGNIKEKRIYEYEDHKYTETDDLLNVNPDKTITYG